MDYEAEEDPPIWKSLGEAYVQQLTFCGWYVHIHHSKSNKSHKKYKSDLRAPTTCYALSPRSQNPAQMAVRCCSNILHMLIMLFVHISSINFMKWSRSNIATLRDSDAQPALWLRLNDWERLLPRKQNRFLLGLQVCNSRSELVERTVLHLSVKARLLNIVLYWSLSHWLPCHSRVYKHGHPAPAARPAACNKDAVSTPHRAVRTAILCDESHLLVLQLLYFCTLLTTTTSLFPTQVHWRMIWSFIFISFQKTWMEPYSMLMQRRVSLRYLLVL